jgi:hypothetical protein
MLLPREKFVGSIPNTPDAKPDRFLKVFFTGMRANWGIKFLVG